MHKRRAGWPTSFFLALTVIAFNELDKTTSLLLKTMQIKGSPLLKTRQIKGSPFLKTR
jgi:hypothetical protein